MPKDAATDAWHGLRLPSCVRWQVLALPALVQATGEDLRALRVRARQREMASGRALARSLLAQCGATEGAVGRGADGAPLWPAGFVGTISHTSALLAVAVAPAHALFGIGIDLELSDGLRDTTPIDALCLNGAERALANACALGPAHARVLFFSAKEALYKCLYPSVRRYIDFREVEVRTCDVAAGTLTLAPLLPLASAMPAASVWTATFCHAAGHVATAVTLVHAGATPKG
jgi:enterobactin synthetase component D